MSETTTDKINLSEIICEYGQAFRHDWSDIDGRAVQYDMEEIASYIDQGQLMLTEEEAITLRASLGLCPLGHGHWDTWCKDENCIAN